MYVDCLNYCASCTKCIQAKPHRIYKPPFQETFSPVKCNQLVTLDSVGPFSNNKYILTVIDAFSRHLELYILNNITAVSVAKSFFKYVTLFGRPELVLTDLGRQFNCELFAKFSQLFNIQLRHTTSANAQANTLSERVNLSIKTSIKALLASGLDFDYAVDVHKACCNASTHSTTEFSRNLVHFGRELSLITDIVNFNINPSLDSAFELHKLLEQLQFVYRKVYRNSVTKKLAQNQSHNEKCKPRNIQAGHLVYLKSKNKYKPSYDGPYFVKKVISPVLRLIQELNNKQAPLKKIHVNRLVKFQKRQSHLGGEQSVKKNNDVGRPESPIPFQVTVNADVVPAVRPQSPDASAGPSSVPDAVPVPDIPNDVGAPVPQHDPVPVQQTRSPYQLRRR
ncbi:uncharacterized protein LOC129220908 [Uloborus diversus]|uniref:uncharacterized protein LOC129220908 n=1 Tax=Uloborus diversus TaxID=327109 RepID=UPI00240A0B13|nr:uncharacterized protein LOC129220908 [Uloborus diversus]